MTCLEATKHMPGCRALVDVFRDKSRFVLGISHQQEELTHMQLMKIRCGGLLGMQRILKADTDVPAVIDIIELATEKYGNISEFPYNEIVRDIQDFNHRKTKKNKQP